MGMSIDEYKKIVLKDDGFIQKRPNRQLQGKRNRELGKNFEDVIEIISEVYWQNRLAIIEKTPEPMKILKHIENGKFETVFATSAQPDFKGVLKGGRTVVFDAKFTESDKIAFSVLSDHQREVLVQYGKLGAMSFVLVGFSDGSIYNIDINTWVNMKNIFGHKHIKKVELDEGGFEAKKAKNGIVDFLDLF